MSTLPILWLLTLGTTPTLPDMYALSDTGDYPGLAEWVDRVRTASVDVETAAQILDNAGLHRVMFPVEIRGDAAGDYGSVSPAFELRLGDEGIGGTIYAHTEGSNPRTLEAACLGGDGALLESRVAVEEITAAAPTRHDVAVQHLDSCWAEGGVLLVLHSPGEAGSRLTSSDDAVRFTADVVPLDTEIAEAAGILGLIGTTGEGGAALDGELADLFGEGGVEGGVLGGVVGGFADGGLGLRGTGTGGGGTAEGLGGGGTGSFGVSSGTTLAVVASSVHEHQVVLSRDLDVVGTLGTEDVRGTVARRLGDLGGCPASGLAGTLEEPGWLDVELEILPGGIVSSVRFDGLEPVAEPASCVSGVLRAAAFPVSDTGAAVQLRLGFVQR